MGNPIYPLQGTKREVVDAGLAIGRQRLTLSYDSTSKAPIADGQTGPLYGNSRVLGAPGVWSSSFQKRILIQGNALSAVVFRGDGYVSTFAGNGAGVYSADSDTKDRLITIAGGYRYLDASAQALETYDAAGRLLAVAYASGEALTFSYSTDITPTSIAPAPGYLIRVEDGRGRAMDFSYELPMGGSAATDGRIRLVTTTGSASVGVAYDSLGNLSELTWSDLKTRVFHYELAAFPWALTGVTDERPVRYATFGYDAAGRAISTEYAGGVNRFAAAYVEAPQIVVTESYDSAAQVVYRSHDWSLPNGTTVERPQGGSTSLTGTSIRGRTYTTSQSQPAGSGCAASSSSQSYDANGNVASRDDFNGNRSCMGYDLGRNLETVRVSGLDTTASCGALLNPGDSLPTGSRKTSTQWHPDWRMAVKLAEPGRLSTNVYNGQPDPFNGNAVANCAPTTALLPDGKPIVVLCKKVEQATTDANGSLGFGAALQAGVANRVWQYTYNEWGQVLTSKDPLNNPTTNTYYPDTTADHTKGDLQQVQNARGHLTRYTKYNAHGQVLQMVDANNVATDYTYDLRQRLKTVSVGGQPATVYDYYPNGLSQQVTQPDGSWVGYEYDDAQRLTAVKDHLGNRIEYTLDNAGQRKEELVKDPGGVLRRQVSRIFDALGRAQEITGRE